MFLKCGLWTNQNHPMSSDGREIPHLTLVLLQTACLSATVHSTVPLNGESSSQRHYTLQDEVSIPVLSFIFAVFTSISSCNKFLCQLKISATVYVPLLSINVRGTERPTAVLQQSASFRRGYNRHRSTATTSVCAKPFLAFPYTISPHYNSDGTSNIQ